MNLTYAADATLFKLYIEGLLHLCVVKANVLAINSYIDHDSKFCIDITMNGGVVKLEYDSRTKWEQVLNVVNERLWEKAQMMPDSDELRAALSEWANPGIVSLSYPDAVYPEQK